MFIFYLCIIHYRNLHSNSDLSTFDACLYFFAYCHRFKLSIKAQEELLKLIRIILPEQNKFPKSLEKLNSEIGLDKIVLQTREYCERCKVLLTKLNK
jgi:hypothetical protein